ncbi:competence type IV pilus major pilin ComGC [Aerococcaceae bacterium WGS1372]
MKKIFKILKERTLNEKAFTLLEVMIVLIVVGLLMAIIIPNVAGQRDRVQNQAQVNIAEVIETQVSTYELVNSEGGVTLTMLYNEDYLTERQYNEAQNLLGLSPDEEISIPIIINE